MQAFGARELHARLHRGDAVGYPGVRAVALRRREALSRDVFKLLDSEVVFKDGTSAVFPDTAAVDSREFAAFFTGAELAVWLGVPAPRPGVPQISLDGDRATRYRVQVSKVSDENEREADTELEFRELQARVFFGDEDRSGTRCVPIAKLVRRGKLVVNRCCRATTCRRSSRAGVGGGDAESRRARRDGAQPGARPRVASAVDRGLSSVEKGADIAGFVKLGRSIAPSRASISSRTCPLLHPYDVYLGLAQVVGNLAVFGEARDAKLPVYDHARTDECFRAVFAAIRALVAEWRCRHGHVQRTRCARASSSARSPRNGSSASPWSTSPSPWRNPPSGGAGGLGREARVGRGHRGASCRASCPVSALVRRMPPTSFPSADLHFFFIETEGASRRPGSTC
jgi:hypothetical protein